MPDLRHPEPTIGLSHLDDDIDEQVQQGSNVLTRPHAAQLVDRYSERKAAGIPLDAASDLSGIVIARQA